MQVATSGASERGYVAPGAAPVAAAPAETTEPSASASAEEKSAEPGVKVSLSAVGLARSKEAENKNADIDESNLPDEIKQLLKMIRELKAQLAQKMAELQALMAQGDMEDDAQQAKVRALQTEVGSISSALSSANAQLVKVMRDQKLTSEQSASVGALLAK
jgi:chromosome segregation ATPase